MGRSDRVMNGTYLYLLNLIRLIIHISPWFLRPWIYRTMGMKIGRGVFIDNDVYIKFPWKVQIGSGTTINRGVSIYSGQKSPSRVIIGSGCRIAPNVNFHAAGHDAYDPEFSNSADDISVGDNVWIGASSLLLQGIRIGDDSVVGAGSIVTRGVGSGEIVAGNPAKKIGERKKLP